jgi:Peptidase A4 family
LVRARLTAAVVGLVSLAVAPAALAQVSESSNWSGYAAHRAGVTFRSVSGVWREPTVSCQNGRETFSSYWVGLGGYSANARALEQTGTEVDCTASGRARAFAWYETVPSPSHPVKLKVPPGDLIQGQVIVTGHKVTMQLRDLTRHTQFTKVLSTSPIDATSAEWIVEAPSECLSLYDCVTLPLANFGSAPFNSAVAQSATGQSGSISSPFWSTTEIKLVPHHSPSSLGRHRLGHSGRATPSPLQSGGSAFSVTYSPLSLGGTLAARSGLPAGGALVHRGFEAP